LVGSVGAGPALEIPRGAASGDMVAEQLANAKKRRRTDFVVDSSPSFDHARSQACDSAISLGL